MWFHAPLLLLFHLSAWFALATRPLTLKDRALKTILAKNLINFDITENIPHDQLVPRSILAQKILDDPLAFVSEHPSDYPQIISNLIDSNGFFDREQVILLLERLDHLSTTALSRSTKNEFARGLLYNPNFALQQGSRRLFERNIKKTRQFFTHHLSLKDLNAEQTTVLLDYIAYSPLGLLLVDAGSLLQIMRMLILGNDEEARAGSLDGIWATPHGRQYIDMERLILLAFFREPYAGMKSPRIRVDEIDAILGDQISTVITTYQTFYTSKAAPNEHDRVTLDLIDYIISYRQGDHDAVFPRFSKVMFLRLLGYYDGFKSSTLDVREGMFLKLIKVSIKFTDKPTHKG